MVRVREIARGASKSARLKAPPGPALDGSELRMYENIELKFGNN